MFTYLHIYTHINIYTCKYIDISFGPDAPAWLRAGLPAGSYVLTTVRAA